MRTGTALHSKALARLRLPDFNEGASFAAAVHGLARPVCLLAGFSQGSLTLRPRSFRPDRNPTSRHIRLGGWRRTGSQDR